ncbi:MAG: DsbE family thiol:disulfide interchange protein [Rhodocyclaceae bacterium]|nr:DsbE family thiol:disulfide interchange protein [Rhodocyclaceae bacterium]MCB1900808.1 DsbE family thiol:disulfide interchange protein [Rhodocyclaceae bacterium]
MKAKFLVPLALFLLLAGFLAYGLKLDPREVPSPLIDKPAPVFSLPQLQSPDTKLSLQDMKGQVWLLNVWASWCVACRQEHPVLVDFASTHVVPIIGLNYKDQSPDALRWLDEFGNPYTTSIVDADGRVGIDFGVYGVPETFLIDKQGVIRYKQIGPVTPDALQNLIIPKIRELQGAA